MFRVSGALSLIVAYKPRYHSSGDILATNLAVDLDHRVTAYRKRNAVGLTHIDAGVVLFRKELLVHIPRGRFCSLEEEIFPKLIQSGGMQAAVTSEPFYDEGTAAGLDRLLARIT
jgi:NDP-sugar pyrophosphorylase family protein